METLANAIDPYYVLTGKVAVALALIRNKPEGHTGKQYAEQTCSSFMRCQLYYKQRLEKLSEVLHVPTKPVSTTTEDNNVVGDETQEDTQDALLTPPSSSEDPRRCDHHLLQPSYADAGLHDQVKLLQSILCLRSLPSSATLTDWEMQDLYLVNVSRAFDTLSQALVGEGSMALQNSVLSNAVEVVCRLINSEFNPTLSSAVMHKTQDLLQTLVVSIINQDGINQCEKQEMRSMVLLQLGRCSHLRQGVLILLGRCLAHFGSGVRQVLSKEISCQPQVCENIFYIFDCMEKLLLDLSLSGGNAKLSGDCNVTSVNEATVTFGKSSRESEAQLEKKRQMEDNDRIQSPSKNRIIKPELSKPDQTVRQLEAKEVITLPKEVLDTINIQLEDSLVLISQHFPCYAYAVWHLKGLLEQCLP